MQNSIEEIISEMNALKAKWVGKPEPTVFGQEFINRGFDRMKYRRLKKRLNELKSKRGSDIVDTDEDFMNL